MKRIPIKIRKPIISDKQYDCPYDTPYGYIYIVTNTLNGHYYIGQHKYKFPYLDPNYQGSGDVLALAYEKYGMENFDTYILAWAKTKKQLNILEIMYIDVFSSYEFPQHYNLTKGGDGGCTVKGKGNGTPWSKETHRKRELWYQQNPDIFKGKNNPNYGNHMSEESKKKLSDMFTGRKRRPHSEETKNAIRNALIGRVVSDETGKKISDSKRKQHLKMSDDIKSQIRRKLGTPVVQLTLNNKFVAKYDSMTQPETMGFGHTYISNCCKGIQYSHNGYKWMYLRDYETMIKEEQIDAY